VGAGGEVMPLAVKWEAESRVFGLDPNLSRL
jgi:hypothetical protein